MSTDLHASCALPCDVETAVAVQPSRIPGFLEKVLPADGRAGQIDTWGPALPDGSRWGSWEAQVPGAPVDVRGTMHLVLRSMVAG